MINRIFTRFIIKRFIFFFAIQKRITIDRHLTFLQNISDLLLNVEVHLTYTVRQSGYLLSPF